MKRTMAKMLQRAEQHDRGEAVIGQAAASPLAEKVADRRRSCVGYRRHRLRRRDRQADWAAIGGTGCDDLESRSSVIRVEDTILIFLSVWF